MKKSLLLLFNPKSGTQKLPARLFDVVNSFTAAGYLVSALPTQGAGEAGAAVRQHAPAFDTLVVAGGDGTVSDAVDALAALEPASRPAFGIIPTGTVNDYAASLGISTDIDTAVATVLGGSPRAVDIGCFGGRHFTYVAAFGLFTDVSYSTPQGLKNVLGKLAYYLEGAKRAVQVNSVRSDITLDGETFNGDFSLGIIANTLSVAGIKIAAHHDARMDDGLFEVLLVQKPRDLKGGQEILSSLLAQQERSALVTMRKAREISFRSDAAVPWTLDGDFGGEFSQVKITNLCRAVEIITPTAD